MPTFSFRKCRMLYILLLSILALTDICQYAPTVSCVDVLTMPLLHPFPLVSLKLMKRNEPLGDKTMCAREKVQMCADFCMACSGKPQHNEGSRGIQPVDDALAESVKHWNTFALVSCKLFQFGLQKKVCNAYFPEK